jgi:hypothetical protein
LVLPALTFLDRTPTLPPSNPVDDELTSGGDAEPEPAEDEVQLRRTTRSTRPPSMLQDYVTCKMQIGLVAMTASQPQDTAHLWEKIS